MRKVFSFAVKPFMQQLHVQDYEYILPQDRIALYPLSERDASKLLVWKSGEVVHSKFSNVSEFLPENAFLFFNDTKVIPARMNFQKSTGAAIEIFLLHPLAPSPLFQEAMAAREMCTWSCKIGNLKRWHEGSVLVKQTDSYVLSATLMDRHEGIVRFTWKGKATFAEIVSEAGQTPLPPYIKRSPDAADRLAYQTIYSHHEGAVAAPTAGLHFTERVFKSLEEKNIQHDFLTLHVSAGTFLPMKTQDANEHTMHHEQIIVSGKNIENMLKDNRMIIAVGTTSMRTLESIYWFGEKLLRGETAFVIGQDDPYGSDTVAAPEECLKAVLRHMENMNRQLLIGETSIFIKPGYKFRICKGLITNFHQPASTLILLVAAFLGEQWKKVYQEALDHDYRFLSYGDSSLLLPQNSISRLQS